MRCVDTLLLAYVRSVEIQQAVLLRTDPSRCVAWRCEEAWLSRCRRRIRSLYSLIHVECSTVPPPRLPAVGDCSVSYLPSKLSVYFCFVLHQLDYANADASIIPKPATKAANFHDENSSNAALAFNAVLWGKCFVAVEAVSQPPERRRPSGKQTFFRYFHRGVTGVNRREEAGRMQRAKHLTVLPQIMGMVTWG